MLVTTTPNIEGRHIIKYCGVVAGQAILGANVFRDLFATFRDLVGGRSASYERELRHAREIAINELKQQAQKIGANAVVGVDLDYEVLGQKKRNAHGCCERNCCCHRMTQFLWPAPSARKSTW